MKNKISKVVGAILISSVLSSCYINTTVVGAGAQGNQEVTKWNHYLLLGLAAVDVSDAKAMAGNADNYSVTTKQSFLNGLVSGVTFGIYTPTTTTVRK